MTPDPASPQSDPASSNSRHHSATYVTPERPLRGPGNKLKNTLVALGFLAPNFLGFLLFVTFPIAFSLWLVFTNWSLKPAIETRFIGLDNVFALLWFRPAEDGGEAAGNMMLLFGFLGSYLLLGASVILSLVALSKKLPGVRLAGWAYLATGIGLVLLGIVQGSGIGWVLFGLTIAIMAVFYIVDDDEEFAGLGIVPAALMLVSILLVRLLRGPFLESWEARDPLFWKYLYNTMYLMFLIPLQIAGSLGLAMLLSKPLAKKGPRARMLTAVFGCIALAGLAAIWIAGKPDVAVLWSSFWAIACLGTAFGVVTFRTIFFLPSFTAGVAIMLLWKQMFNPEFGPLNESLRAVFSPMLGVIGIEADWPRWLLDPHWAKPALILMGFWTLVGGTNMLIYLAGLANIPGQLYEAAKIDGASKWQEFKSVTWPQLAPTTFFIVIMSMIAGLQGGFEQARVMTEGGPAGATKTLSYYIYEKAFEELSLGYASAIAWIMFLLIFGLTALNWKFGNQYVNE